METTCGQRHIHDQTNKQISENYFPKMESLPQFSFLIYTPAFYTSTGLKVLVRLKAVLSEDGNSRSYVMPIGN